MCTEGLWYVQYEWMLCGLAMCVINVFVLCVVCAYGMSHDICVVMVFGEMFEMCNMFVVCVYLSVCIYGKCVCAWVLSIGMSVCACLWRVAVCVTVCILNPIPTMETDWESRCR